MHAGGNVAGLPDEPPLGKEKGTTQLLARGKMPGAKKTLERGVCLMFSDSKVAQLETKLDIYEELSREMLAKLETAVDKISEGNNRIAQILS